MKKVNRLPLMAFILGLGFIVAMSSFKGEEMFVNETWYFHNGTWVKASDIVLEPNQSITCEGDEGPCSARFVDTADPNNPTGPQDLPTYLDDQDFGTFNIVTNP